MRKTLHLIMVFITTLTLHAQQIGEQVTEGTMTYTITNDNPLEVECSGYTDPATDAEVNVVIPETITPIPEVPEFVFTVTGVGEFAFSGANNAGNLVIETVTLPSTVTTLKQQAFGNLSNLTTINLDNVEVLGSKVLVVCGSLTDVGSMEKVTTIGDYCFNRCVNITDYQFSNALTHIGTGAIYNSSGSGLPAYGPELINIPSSVATMGTLNFGGYGNLRAIQVNWASPADVTISGTLSNFVRWQDRSTITVFVPTGKVSDYQAGGDAWTGFNFVEGTLDDYVKVATVGDSFTDGDFDYQITSLEPAEVAVTGTSSEAAVITIPEKATDEASVEYTVVATAGNAFVNNATVTEFVLPATLKTLGSFSMAGTPLLTTVNTENVTTIEGNAFRGSAVTTLDLSELTTLASNGLGRMYSLTGTLDLPKVTSIEAYAFVYAQGLSAINFGPDVATADVNAFFGVPSLQTITIEATTPPTATGDFTPGTVTSDREGDELPSADFANVTLKVPDGSVSAYEAALGWQVFGTTETLSIDDIKAGTLAINVTSDAITVNSSSTFADATVSVYDITGRLLVSQSVNGVTGSVNISNLASGIYIVKVAEGGAELVKRFAK